ncbi:MAG: hypothetical protein JWN51_3256 [Phycisphaerales bacterium]|nr:hypothetical protein [Phycisphaerales bacterium]
MEKLQIKYRTAGKALAPRPIRMPVPGWGGSPDKKKENGSVPQPWHCPPLVEGATYGVELVYHYDTECHVINDNGQTRIEWDYAREPGGVTGIDDFTLSDPRPSNVYMFATSVHLQAPPGYVLRTQPHPRCFFPFDTGTVPHALIAHVQSEWWPKKLFVAFQAPRPGQRHIFRKGEPYAQILFVPRRMTYEMTKMEPEEAREWNDLETNIKAARSYIAKNVWHSPSGSDFNDHYNVLARTFAREGVAGVKQVVDQAVERMRQAVPNDLPVSELLKLASRHRKEGKYVEARDVYFLIRRLDPTNVEAVSELAHLAASIGLMAIAHAGMSQAVAMQPRSAAYRADLGEVLRRMGRFDEAEAALRASLELNSTDPQVMSNLGLTLAQKGRAAEGLQACQAALALDSNLPVVHLRMGSILAQLRQHEQARESYSSALALDPGFTDASRAMAELPANGHQATPALSLWLQSHDAKARPPKQAEHTFGERVQG